MLFHAKCAKVIAKNREDILYALRFFAGLFTPRSLRETILFKNCFIILVLLCVFSGLVVNFY